eukprot:1187336-Prorocentrum_minimum.AAC.13
MGTSLSVCFAANTRRRARGGYSASIPACSAAQQTLSRARHGHCRMDRLALIKHLVTHERIQFSNQFFTDTQQLPTRARRITKRQRYCRSALFARSATNRGRRRDVRCHISPRFSPHARKFPPMGTVPGDSEGLLGSGVGAEG